MIKASISTLLAAGLALISAPLSAQVVVLDADFNQNTVGAQPPADIPGDPGGDYFTFRTAAGTITVEAAFGVMTDQPLVMNRKTTGSFTLKAHVAPDLGGCGTYVVRWTGMITEVTDNVNIQFTDQGTSNLATLHYRPAGALAINGFQNELSVGYQANVPQVFELTLDIPGGTTSLSIDGVPVPEAQNRPNVQANLTSTFDGVQFAIAGLEYEEYIIDDILVTAIGCSVPTRKSTWSQLKIRY